MHELLVDDFPHIAKQQPSDKDFFVSVLKIVLVVGLMLDLAPKTEPRMIATIDRITNEQIGMANLFL